MEKVEQYIESTFHTKEALLEEIKASIMERGMPSISVSPNTGKLLTMLVAISGAKEILEIGALGGYSGTCLARGLDEQGRLTSLELEEEYGKLAHANLTKAGLGNKVTYLIGEALTSLETLVNEQKRFDFFFIDADKENYENYLEYCIKLAAPGALIVTDNVLAVGSVADETLKRRKYTDSMKKFYEIETNHSCLEALLIPIGDIFYEFERPFYRIFFRVK
ncbi:O-methyltransferase [Alkalihalobacterium chitinilyticum]|uniref:O-methyltransferase n=1 Tax=Alkalihalobacterium chitinilyticum TaxID=2980103 RepID=A0ABT5VJE5_9BACI|nr:O-methyltransferase [Alkalihalobacterium chitinilyticum]MDE5415395.1 O-methyltransferase [Alkalihalobacterium chitinilyticum]